MKSYLSVLSAPGAWRFLFPALLARLPFAMMQLGILLLLQWSTGSYGWGGIAAAGAAVAQAVVGPQTGRLADRYGQARILIPQAAAHAVLLGGLLVLAQAHAPALLLITMACLAGASMPQVGSMVRARWANLLGGRCDGRLDTAFAVESITDELTFTAAPILLIGVATAFSPVWALLVALILTVVGTLLFAAVRQGAPEPIPVRTGGSRGQTVLRLRGVGVLAGAFLTIGTVFGSLQVGITAFTAGLGQAGTAGLVYGAFSGASMVGGLGYGALRWKLGAPLRLAVLLGLLAAATVLPALAGTLGLMYAAAIIAGFVIAPAVITGYTLLAGLVPAEVRTEAYTWLNGSIALGIAIGAAVAGQLVDRFTPTTAFLLPPVLTAVAALVVLLRRACLSSVPIAPRPARELVTV
ncbi:MAG: MFS transporter [Streptosporangiaceae bacterium]